MLVPMSRVITTQMRCCWIVTATATRARAPDREDNTMLPSNRKACNEETSTPGREGSGNKWRPTLRQTITPCATNKKGHAWLAQTFLPSNPAMTYYKVIASVHPETLFPDDRGQLSAISFKLNVFT